MKKFVIYFSLILITILTTNAFGVYAAPNEDTVVVCGGLGTMANASDTNGGGATKAVWDVGSPSDFINTNGGPVTNDTGCALTGATHTIAKTGIGTGVTVGTLAYVIKTSGAGTITTGIWEVTARTNDTIVIGDCDASGDCTVTVNVGGSFATLQAVFDDQVNDATSSSSRYIYLNGVQSDNDGTVQTAVSIDFDQQTGVVGSRIFIEGYDNALATEAEFIIQGSANVAGGVVTMGSGSDFTQWHNISFDCGAAADLFDWGLYSVSGSISHVFISCKFYNADLDGVYVATGATRWLLIDCETNDNGDNGIEGAGANCDYINNKCHDNTDAGMYITDNSVVIENNQSYDNGTQGVRMSATANYCIVKGNTFEGNGSDGIQIDAASTNAICLNNTSCNNGGYGYDLQGTNFGVVRFFGYNHANGNTGNAGDTTHCTEFVDTSWAAFMNGNNQSGAPSFTNIGDGVEDYTPLSGSDLINNGYEYGGTGTIDIGAIQEASGGAGGNPRHGTKNGGKQ